MNGLTAYLTKLITPLNTGPEDGVRYWQEKILSIMLLVGLALGFVTWLPSITLALKEQLWGIAALDTLILLVVAVMFFRPDLPYRFRAPALPVISYVLGLILLLTVGPFGAGPVWLFFFPVLTGLLLGRRAARHALMLNAATLVLVGILISMETSRFPWHFPFRTWYVTVVNPLGKWGVISVNFMFLNILATLSVAFVLNGLQTSLSRLRASRKKYRGIFDNILDIYFETLLDGTVLEVSPSVESISGFNRQTLLGTSIFDHFEIPAHRHDFLADLIRSGHLDNYEVGFKDIKGDIHTCLVRAQLARGERQHPDRIIGIVRDITENKAMARKSRELEEQLNRAQKMEALGLLAGGVAHDLNNVLSGMVTYPELLLLELPPDDPMRESLEIIHSSGQRATRIVQDLLTLSRRGVTTFEVLDLNTVVTRFMETPEYRKILAQSPGIRIRTELSARAPLVRGSLVHLQKCIMNLLSNAAEAQPRGGLIRLATGIKYLEWPVKGYSKVRAGRYVVLTVEDQGAGISGENLKRIFEPFFTTKKMGRSGTGLGMAVVWGTVQDHKGYIDVNSRVGSGTRFDLYFPVTKETADTPDAKPSLESLRGHGQRILIVDDAKDQREIAARTLKRLGYDPVSVPGGEAAVRFLETQSVHLVVLDMIMDGGIDGLETLHRILRINPGQKTIIASGFSQTGKVRSALALGACQYVRKPYSLEEIGRAVQQALAPPESP